MGIKGLGAVYATQGGENLFGRTKTKKQHKNIYFSAIWDEWRTVLRLEIDVNRVPYTRAGGCAAQATAALQFSN